MYFPVILNTINLKVVLQPWWIMQLEKRVLAKFLEREIKPEEIYRAMVGCIFVVSPEGLGC